MKAVQYLRIALVALATAACSKDDECGIQPDPTPNPPVAENQLGLIYPKEVTDLNPCCIPFSWSAGKGGSYRFQLSPNANFNGTLLDTVLLDTIFNYTPQLLPNTTYYWRVQDSTTQQSTFFKTKDVLAGFLGNYVNANVHRYYWSDIVGIGGDTSYTASISISRTGNTLRFQHPNENIDRTMQLWIVQDMPNAIRYHTSPGSINDYAIADLYYLTDSVVVQNSTGGLGGGVRWTYRMKHD